MSVAVYLLVANAWADPFVLWPQHVGTDGFGDTYGISVADVDGDGWTDVIAPDEHMIWFNIDGKDWSPMPLPELNGVSSPQYGVSLGDYDEDGLPDLSTEPRGNAAVLLHNDGGGEFTQLPPDQFPPAAPSQSAETNAYVDVDGDGWLDLFVPAYYGDSGLWHNLGPDLNGDHFFDELASQVGIHLSVTWQLRPEGAQFADIDRDGDPDLYVCGQLLRNESIPGDIWLETDHGAGLPHAFDEGAAFADIDMDGDFDIGILYHDITWPGGGLPNQAMLIWENHGDSTFTQMHISTVDRPDITETYNLGMSFADWDHDGDPDLTFTDRFQQNDFVETGDKIFNLIETIAAQTNATPAWFDWDYDGDQDIALGIWADEGYFVENTLYDGVPLAERQYLRVRPVKDSTILPDGVDNEFGATVEVRVQGEAPEKRRRNFTASGHGYLNQSEYTLTFGLEGLSSPVVDVSVDFVNPAPDGVWRIDKYVNPALGDIDVLSLTDREIRVFRSGTVVVDGQEFYPTGDEVALLETPDGIWQPDRDALLDGSSDKWVGLEVQVPTDNDPERGAAIREVIVEGQLGAPVTCGEATGNVLLWDMTGKEPVAVAGEVGPQFTDNRRTDVHTDFELVGGRTYRVLANVHEWRTFDAGDDAKWLSVEGAVELDGNALPCDASQVAAASVESGPRSVTVRYRERVVPPPEPEEEELEEEDPNANGSGDDKATLAGSGSCGCSTTGTSGWLALLVAAGVLVRSRRRLSP